jgi:hypothetical protein
LAVKRHLRNVERYAIRPLFHAASLRALRAKKAQGNLQHP